MDPKNQKKSMFKTFLYIAVLVLACVFVYMLISTGNSGENINQTEFYSKLENNEISDVFAQGGTVYVRKVGSEIEQTKFPKFSDYYFTYSTSDELAEISNVINDYNDGDYKGNATTYDISYSSQVQGESLLSQILPYISIAIILVIGFFIFKTIMSNNKGAMSFGKSKIRVGENIKVKFDDVAGADEEKQEVQEIVEFLKNPQKFTELGARIPKGVLLVGPPGTGKTLLAKAIAGESNVPFLSISGSDFVEMFVGVGASRVRDLFDTAKKNLPCIVFIDEIDAVGRQRGVGLGGGNDEREQTLNQLLIEMDGFQQNEGIIVLAATNRSDILDPALTRPGRFDRQIYVHVPDVKGREGIMRIHAKNKPLSSDINFTTLARLTSGFTGADLESMLNEAAILAARQGKSKITMTDIQEGINKVIMGPQKKSRVITERDKKITAFHEAGHAILGVTLKNCDEVQEVSIIPRGMAGGYTLSRPETDDNYTTENKLNDYISMAMGGRIAEEIVFGDISTGASGDIKHATEIARRMVVEWGMSDKIGFVGLDSSNELLLGRDYQVRNKYSEKIAAEIDDEIKRIINKNYTRAKKILNDNRDVLDEMSKLLLLKNTIYSEEINMLITGKKAEEIAELMTKKEEMLEAEERKAHKEKEEQKKNKEHTNKIKTAEVLARAGVISQEELEKIKSEGVLKSDKKQQADTTSEEKADKNKSAKKEGEDEND